MNHRLEWYRENPPKNDGACSPGITGRVVVGRNTPGCNLTIKGSYDGVFLQDSDTQVRESEQKYSNKVIY